MIMKKRFKQTQEKGFTLIEFVVVIAIMAILSLVAIPSFASYRENASNAKDLQNARIGYNRLILEDREMSNDELHSLVGLSESDKLIINEDGSVTVNKQTYPSLIGGSNDNEEIDNLIVEGYIPVATADELNNVRDDETNLFGKGTKWEKEYTGGLDKKYIQVADINLSGYGNWTPIGSFTTNQNKSPFTGSFDGNGYKTTGLTINSPETEYVGLFGYTEGATDGATISNVSLEDVNVTGKSYVGGLVGEAYSDVTISNSYVTGQVKGTDTYRGFAGGLVGNAYQGPTIINSYTTVDVTGSGNSIGGLVGYTTYSTIENSYATGSVESSGRYTGGLVGTAYSNTKISNSYATGSVEGSSWVGGLTGNADYGDISNSYATGSVTGTGRRTGGLVGEAKGSTIKNSYAEGSVSGASEVGGLVGYFYNSAISNSYATGSVEGTDQVGGLVGEAHQNSMISSSYATGSVIGSQSGGLVGLTQPGSSAKESYWDTLTTGQSTSAGGEGKSTVEMKDKDTYTNWDFDTAWEITPGNYPTLR